jgi:hypothetical protein
MGLRSSRRRLLVLWIAVPGLAWICGCAANAPWFHHATDEPYYVSGYFRVASPQGSGWKVKEERPSDVLERYGYHYESDLFDEFVPPKFIFEKYTAKDIFPQPTHNREVVELYSTFMHPGLDGNNPRQLAETVNARTLERLVAESDTLVDPKWELKRSDVAKIGGHDFHEFVMANGATGIRRRFLFQYITFTMDFGVACVANVPSLHDTLPAEAERVLSTLESVEPKKTPEALAMERAAQDVYELTLKRFGGHTLVVYPGETQKDLRDVLRADPERKKAHLFLGAMQLLTEDLGPVIGAAGELRVKLGLWDFYCVLPSGTVVHSLFDGYSLDNVTINEFRAELELNPRSFWARYYVAGLYVRHDELTRAEEEARPLTEYYPESALGWYTLGIALERADNVHGARLAFNEALRNDRGEFNDPWSLHLPSRNLIRAQLQSLEGS